MKKYLVICLLCLFLSGCSSISDRMEESFSVISELCKANFAPSSQDEYTDVFNKYKNTYISEEELTKFFDIGKTVHTDVSLTNYECKYYNKPIGDLTRYEASMRLSSKSLYMDIIVTFYVEDGKIVKTVINEVKQ